MARQQTTSTAFSVLPKLFMIGAIVVGIGLRLWPVIVHQGLPGGDSYMAILWARIIERDLSIPAYAEIASLWLSTAPTTGLFLTYLTPFLHSFLFALVGLTGVSDFAVVLVLVVSVWVGILFLMFRMVDRVSRFEALAVIAVLSLLGVRTFRYFSQTGFHFQNLVGDLFVILMILLAFNVMKREGVSRIKAYLLLLVVGPVTVLFFHQLSGILVFVVLLFFFPILLLLTPLPKDIAFRRRLKVTVIVAVGGLSALVLLVLSIPFFAELAGRLVMVSPDVRSILGPWNRYAEFMGPALWFLGVGGALVAFATLVAGYVYRRKGLRGFQIPERRRHLLLLGLAWLSATLVLSRSQDLGLKLPGLRFLWYAAYPLALLTVIGFMSIRYFISMPDGSRTAHLRPAFQVGFVVVVLVSSYLTIPYMSSLTSVAPPGVNFGDSTYNGEVAAVVDFLRSSISADSTVWIDWRGWRSLIWLRTELVPSHSVGVTVLPGSAFNRPIDEQSLEQFYASPPGSMVVKSLVTKYSYITEHGNFTFLPVATSPHLEILEKVEVQTPPPILDVVELAPRPITSPSVDSLLVLPVVILPGFFAVGVFRDFRRLLRSNHVWSSIAVSTLLIGVVFTTALFIGWSNVWLGLALMVSAVVGVVVVKFVRESFA